MDVVLLSRLQFTAATIFHFIFVPLTLGLSVLVAWMETQYVRTGDETYLSMTKFWGKIFLINFALGVVTGITLEFQFGTNWSRYSAYVGDIFGSLLAIEATAAFFLESTFIGVWIWGWNKISRKAHAIVMWLVAFASNLSAVWIIIANGWMQHPVGFDIRNGRAELTSFTDVVFNPFAWMELIHVLAGAFVVAGFLVMGISAYYLLRKEKVDFFTRSFKIGLTAGLLASLVVAVEGDLHASHVAEVQPAKLAAMETLWDTQTQAPIYLFSIPDEEKETNLVELGRIPGLLSFLAFKDTDAEVRGLKAFPKDERPPVLITSLAFKGMVGLGTYFIGITLIGWLLRNRLTESPLFLKIMLFSIPLPYIANELGWILAEVGRQPWIVYGLMKTQSAASPVEAVQVLISLIAFIAGYGVLGAVGVYLVVKTVKNGPALAEGEV